MFILLFAQSCVIVLNDVVWYLAIEQRRNGSTHTRTPMLWRQLKCYYGFGFSFSMFLSPLFDGFICRMYLCVL